MDRRRKGRIDKELLKMPSISFVLPAYPRAPIGGYKVVYQYANHLSRHGHKVTVVHMRASHTKPPPLPKKIALRTAYRIARKRKPKWARLDTSVRVINKFEMRADGIPRSDYYIATSVTTADAVACKSAVSGQGIYLIQGYEDFTVSPDEVLRTWRLPLKRIVVSQWLRDLLKEQGLSANLVSNGVDRQLFRGEQPVNTRPTHVLAMISQHEYKRTDLVIEVSRILYNRDPTLTFVTFGTITRPTPLPLHVKHVQLPTPQELSALYASARIFLCTSDFEGFGLPALEAMSSGCAVITTDNGGVPSLGATASVVVNRGDASALAAAIANTLEDEPLLARLAANGQTNAETLSADRMSDLFSSTLFNTNLGSARE